MARRIVDGDATVFEGTAQDVWQWLRDSGRMPYVREPSPRQKLARSMRFVVTTTTRSKREIESNGVHYDFVSRDKFEGMIKKKKLLEWAEVYGNYYGVPRDWVERAFKEGRDVMVKVDVQGAMTIKKVMPQAVLIFLAAPSMEELEDR